jgi:hypothetical protein
MIDEVFPNIYVGGDVEYEQLKDRKDFSFVRCCKYGPDGHQQTLGYKSASAPKGKDYLTVIKDNRLCLNMIDKDDPNFFPDELIQTAIAYIKGQIEAGKKVLVACNKGHSRGPTVALLYLRSIGEMPWSFIRSEMIFRTLYPAYNPEQGIRQKARELWPKLGRDIDELVGQSNGIG